MRPGSLHSLIAALGLATAAVPGQQPVPTAIRGITISTHGIGREWADAECMRPTMQRIRATGATWVALHPYARIRRDGSVDWRRYARRRGRAAERDAGVPAHWHAPIRYAHEAGLKVLIKPHLSYWGSPFRWRGEIEFRDDGAWKRFFREYSAWIELVARSCKDADGFCAGTELDRTLQREKEWRAVIARLRHATGAPLTYAANWSHYDVVPFWDALDVIGIQAYFPLCNGDDPDLDELRVAWNARMKELRAFADKTQKDIVFTELGYNTSFNAAKEPWDARSDGNDAEPLQLRCLEVALAAIEREPRVCGSFLWKWFPEPRAVGRDFPLATPGVTGLLEESWKTSLPKPGSRPGRR